MSQRSKPTQASSRLVASPTGLTALPHVESVAPSASSEDVPRRRSRLHGVRLACRCLLRLPEPRLPLDLPRDVHRAELRPAHRAEFRALEVLGGEGLIVQLTRPVGIERQPELLVPVERITRARKRVR